MKTEPNFSSVAFFILLCIGPWDSGLQAAQNVVHAASPTKPNVLFIVLDDLKPLLGCYGDKTVKTPNIDRLAKRGVTFTKAYCMQAVCAPSRNAFMTGLRPESLHIYDLGTFFRTTAPDVVTLPQYFKQNGWISAGVGKVYHTDHGNRDDDLSWSLPHEDSDIPYILPENKTKKPTMEMTDLPEESYGDGKISALGIKRLEELKASGLPFFLAIGFRKPHMPFAVPTKYWDLYDPNTFSMPVRQTPPEDAPEYAATPMYELRKYSDIPPVGPVSPEMARKLIHGYHAAASFADAQVGKVLTALDRLKLTENTIIVLLGDNGWHLGDHGFWCKHTNYEQASNVPLLFSIPDEKNAGSRCNTVVEFVDIYPTLCDLAGLQKPTHLQGESLASVVKRKSRASVSGNAFHVYPRIAGSDHLLGQAIRNARYRLVEWQRPDGSVKDREFYDYQTDPDETINLASKPEHAALIADLSGRIHARLASPPPKGVTLLPPPTRILEIGDGIAPPPVVKAVRN